MKRVLIAIEDPGAANMIVGLPAALAHHGVATAMMAGPHARAYLADRGEPAEPLSAPVDTDALFDKIAPDLLLVGTSEDRDCAAFDLTHKARNRGIPSVGIVDSTVNAGERFKGNGADALAHCPDRLAVPDALTRRAFVELGLPERRVFVAGNPLYDRLRDRRTELTNKDRITMRQTLFPGAATDQDVIVFVSEVSAGLAEGQYRRSDAYTLHGRGAHDERTAIVLEEVLDIASNLDRPPYIVLRLHPKNDAAEFAAYGDEIDQVSSGDDPTALIWSADLIVGMASSLMAEAVVLDRPVLSVVPRAEEAAWLPALADGTIPVATCRAELAAMLPRLLRQKERTSPDGRDWLPVYGALDRLAGFLAGMMNDTAPSQRAC